MVDTTICEALRLKTAAKEEAERQSKNRDEGRPYNFFGKNCLELGVHALGEVLWKIFGGYP